MKKRYEKYHDIIYSKHFHYKKTAFLIYPSYIYTPRGTCTEFYYAPFGGAIETQIASLCAAWTMVPTDLKTG